jgi:hypothetical protein
MFTQMTDHAFIGTYQQPPTHADREWVGAAVYPLAVVGDIITAPFQGIVLMIRGDYGIYATRDGRVTMQLGESDSLRVASIDAAGHVTELALTDAQRGQLAERLRSGAFTPEATRQVALNN